jgi:ubiquinol-cytochrome c reductase iron-sulfur subunit
MVEQVADTGRRRFLTGTTVVVGAVGTIFAAVPFVKSWLPSAKAQNAGAPVTLDISKLAPGQRLQVGSNVPQWRGQPIWVIRRTPEMLAGLAGLKDQLRDPDSSNEDQQPAYAKNDTRAVRPEILVLVGICTHLGCSPLFKPELTPQPFDPEWKGGFFCPCHGSKFDMAGRVYQGVPAPYNLKVPPYKFEGDATLIIGVNPTAGAA